MALGSTQPLTEMSTRSISWGKGSRCVRLTNLPPSCAVVMKSGKLNFPEPSAPLQASNGTALHIYAFAQYRGTGYSMNLKVKENEVRLTNDDGKPQCDALRLNFDSYGHFTVTFEAQCNFTLFWLSCNTGSRMQARVS